MMTTRSFDPPAEASSVESTSATTTYHRVMVDGVGIFYREAGPKGAPTIVHLAEAPCPPLFRGIDGAAQRWSQAIFDSVDP
jgi:hypothetical protein